MTDLGNDTSNLGAGGQGPVDYRSQARQLALQFLHQLAVQGDEGLAHLEGFLSEFSELKQVRVLAGEWVQATWQEREEIDRMIQSVSCNWDVGRLSQVDLSNLRLAVHQLVKCREIPAKVVINEAIELAKLFSSTESGGFVNGVLDSVRRQLPDR